LLVDFFVGLIITGSKEFEANILQDTSLKTGQNTGIFITDALSLIFFFEGLPAIISLTIDGV